MSGYRGRDAYRGYGGPHRWAGGALRAAALQHTQDSLQIPEEIICITGAVWYYTSIILVLY